MRINSKFKDYYDYIGHKFGQDPDVVYNRGPIPKAEEYQFGYRPDLLWRSSFIERQNCLYWVVEDLFRKNSETSDPTIKDQFLYVCAGELIFPYIQREIFREEWDQNAKKMVSGLSTIEHIQVSEGIVRQYLGAGWEGERAISRYEAGLEKLKRGLPEIQRELNAPVFEIYRGFNGVHVSQYPPRLADFDIPSRVSAQDMWQNIYSTMTNVLRKNPDKEPPVKISNQDKIVKAGFDLKTSFRNPINQKPKKRK